MAAGDTKLMSDTIRKDRSGQYSISDDWRIVFFADTFGNINSTVNNPTSSTYSVVSGGNFASSYPLLNETIVRSGAVIAFSADDIGQIAKDASNPAIKTAGLINATNNDDLFQVWDMTSDGTTAVDTINNDFTFNFGAAGMNTSTNTST